jgi:hypothetical protein
MGPDESDDEDDYIYNPLKLPLGWDGKPIPYWLYKLHGLNIEFKCEICGNASYWGRRAYERHFTVRHVLLLAIFLWSTAYLHMPPMMRIRQIEECLVRYTRLVVSTCCRSGSTSMA